jgi:Putative glycolipid-binding
MVRTAVWRGLDAQRMEIARVDLPGPDTRMSGTQIGVSYELRYAFEPGLLRLELVGSRTLEVALDGLDFFDLGLSPLFNSLPVWRDGLLEEGPAREYAMRFVSVPELEVVEAEQVYEPLGEGRVRFRSGDFSADLAFDDEGLVVRYEGLAERLA